VNFFLLLEDGTFQILTEDGGDLLLEGSTGPFDDGSLDVYPNPFLGTAVATVNPFGATSRLKGS
jgi:hypothetical protein